MTLLDTLHVEIVEITRTRCEARLPITPEVCQMHGFVHGGTTLALLETVASMGANECADLARERPFGTVVSVRHRKPGVKGWLRGVAELASERAGSHGSRVQLWNVAAYDDEGDVISEGTVETKIVTLARLEEKKGEHRTAR